MYKGFFEDVEYVMGLFFKPFEGCCPEDGDREDEEEKDCGMGCDSLPCCREEDDDDEDEDEEPDGKGCDATVCCREEDDEDENSSEQKGGLLGKGPLQDVLKCMFDASDTDYDYED